MTQIGSVYGGALYALAKDEEIVEVVRRELVQVDAVLQKEPDYLRLLSAANIPRQERCDLVDRAFRNKVHPYVLNFLKILTEKGYIRQFPDCCDAYRSFYNEDNGILVVKAQSAVALTDAQKKKLTAKLTATTGKTIDLQCSIDPAALGGLRLSYDGKQVDGTVQNRLDAIGKLLKNTVL